MPTNAPAGAGRVLQRRRSPTWPQTLPYGMTPHTTPIPRDNLPMNIQQFQTKWQGATLKERSAAQEHFLDLCHALGQPTPAEADPNGDWYAFEKGAAKSTGGQGFADVWISTTLPGSTKAPTPT
jgi:hypothetical protein